MEKRICLTIEQTSEAFNNFDFSVFSLDTETSSKDGSKDGALRYDKCVLDVITLYDGKVGLYIDMNIGNIEYIRTYFEAFVNKPGNTVICHNIVFDMKVLHKYGISLRDCTWFDTLVAQHLLDENCQDNRLKTLAKDKLNKEVVLYEDIKGTKDYTNSQFVDYAINDTVYTYDLALLFSPLLQEQGLAPLFRDIEMPFMRPLLDIEINGILIDEEKLKSISTKMSLDLSNLKTQIYEKLDIKYEVQCDLYGGMKIVCDTNLDSSEDLADILFNKLGLKAVEFSEKTGKPSVGKFTLENLKGQHEIVDMLIKYKQLSKLLSSFSIDTLGTFIDLDGRVRANYRDTGTVTGRLSCNSPNLQQLPKDNKVLKINLRDIFIAPEGKNIISCDYSGQEIRVLAQVTQDPTLLKALNSGADLHLTTANTFFSLNIPEEALMSTHKDFDMYKNKFKEERNKAKAITFGLAYGKSGFGFSKDFGISEEEGNAILNKYFTQFPSVKKSMDLCNKELDKTDSVTQLFGRKRRFTKVTNGTWTGHIRKSYRQAFNFLIQSPSADMIRLASIETYKLSKLNPHWELKQIASIHDENLYEVKEEYTNVAKREIKKCFERVVHFGVQMLAEVGEGKSYGEAK